MEMKRYIQDKLASRGSSKSSQSRESDILDLALTDPDYDTSASISELMDQLKSFLFAGHDTTASTISWSYYFLSHHPNELQRLRNELDEVFGDNTTPAQVAQKFIEDPKIHTKLNFTLAVIKESLRLEPPVSPTREVPKNYHFRTRSGVTINPPQGAMIYISTSMLHRNKDVWGDDASEFKPDRFVSGNPVPRGYLAFSKRPRDCIGSNLALLEERCLFDHVDDRLKLSWHSLRGALILSRVWNFIVFSKER